MLAFFVIAGAAIGDIYSAEAPALRIRGAEFRPIVAWQICYLLGCIGYLLLLWSFLRRPTKSRTILLAAVLLRIPLLFSPPNSDCNRYLWEGRVQELCYSPYTHAPADEAVRHLRDDVWQGINKKHYPTIYPPLAQLEFRLLAAIHHSVKTAQVAHAIFDFGVVVIVAVMLRRLGRPNWHLAIYALCPIVLAAFAHAGHSDSLMILCVVGFLAAGVAGRWGWAGLALGLAILAKTTPAILLALLVRRSWKAIGVALVTVAAGYALYLDAGVDLFHALVQFPSRDGPFNNLLDALRVRLREAGGPAIDLSGRNVAAIVILLALATYRACRPLGLAFRSTRRVAGHASIASGEPGDLLIRDARWLLVAVVLLLPIIHFWYMTWPLAIISLHPRGCWSWLVLVVTMMLYWYADWAGQVGLQWKLPLWVTAAIWGPFFATWMAENVRFRGPRLQSRGLGA